MVCTFNTPSLAASDALANATENTGLTIVLYHRCDLEHSYSVSSHGLTIATVSLWVHLILSSNLSRKFKTLLQDSFSWHPVTTTQHLSWKNCTGFPFQNVLSCLYVFQRYKRFWSCLPLWTATCLHSSSDTSMLKIQQYKHKTHGFRTFSCFGPHIWNSLPQDLRHCSALSSVKAKLKTFLFSQYFHPN